MGEPNIKGLYPGDPFPRFEQRAKDGDADMSKLLSIYFGLLERSNRDADRLDRMSEAAFSCYQAFSEWEVAGITNETIRLRKEAMNRTHPLMVEAGYV